MSTVISSAGVSIAGRRAVIDGEPSDRTLVPRALAELLVDTPAGALADQLGVGRSRWYRARTNEGAQLETVAMWLDHYRAEGHGHIVVGFDSTGRAWAMVAHEAELVSGRAAGKTLSFLLDAIEQERDEATPTPAPASPNLRDMIAVLAPEAFILVDPTFDGQFTLRICAADANRILRDYSFLGAVSVAGFVTFRGSAIGAEQRQQLIADYWDGDKTALPDMIRACVTAHRAYEAAGGSEIPESELWDVDHSPALAIAGELLMQGLLELYTLVCNAFTGCRWARYALHRNRLGWSLCDENRLPISSCLWGVYPDDDEGDDQGENPEAAAGQSCDVWP